MTAIHAVIYARSQQGAIARAKWEGTDDVAGIVKLREADDSELKEILEGFKTTFGEASSVQPLHDVRRDNGADPNLSAARNPFLLVFLFEQSYWVARGFRPYGSTITDGETKVWILTSDDPPSASFDETAANAQRLFDVAANVDETGAATAGEGSQALIDELELTEVDFSVAFTSGNAINSTLGAGSLADFGNSDDFSD